MGYGNPGAFGVLPPSQPAPQRSGGGSGSGWNGMWDYAGAKTAEDQVVADEHRAEVGYNVEGYGGSLGSYGDRKDVAYETSPMRWDQSNAERVSDQIGNYSYGGYEGGAQDAIGAMRGYMDPYTQQLQGYGGYAMGQSAQGAADYGQGQQGLYGTADTLTQYAQQGPGPSVAQAQLDANTGAAMRQQLAMAGSGRGAGGGASAFRQAADNQALIQGQANANAGMLQAQEAADWRQAQLQAYGAAGSMYGQGAGLGAEYGQGMAGLGIGAVEGAGNMQLGQEQVANQINTAALGGSTGYEQNLTDIYGINKGVPKSGSGDMTTKDWIGAGVAAAGTIASMYSDERIKKNVQPASALSEIKTAEERRREKLEAQRRAGGQALTSYGLSMMSDIRAKKNIQPASALDAVSEAEPYSYDYIDPERHGEGQYIGPMAQDLEGAPGVVHEDKNGTKMIDPGRLTTLNTSAIAELNNKVDTLAGQTQPVEYSGDPARLQFEAEKYGTPIIADEEIPEEDTSSFLDRWLGPTVGQQAADTTEEERRNWELRQLFLNPPREDTYL